MSTNEGASERARLVVLYGPPGVGKRTVGTELARLTGYALFDNHASINIAQLIAPMGSEPFRELRERIRDDVFEVAAMARRGVVFTYVYEYLKDDSAVERYCEAFESRGGTVHLVRLHCERSVLDIRVQSPERAARHKIISPSVLASFLGTVDAMSAMHEREGLEIDTTELSAHDAARRIIEHCQLPTLTA